MTGLDQIMDIVLQDATEKAEAIKQEALDKAFKAEEALMQNLSIAEARAKEEADAAAVELEQKGMAAATRKVNQSRLALKQKLIDELVEQIRQGLLSMTDEEYEAYVLTRLSTIDETQTGELQFVPRNGVVIEKSLKEKIQGKYPRLKILDLPLTGDGGFLLKIGEVQENYTFQTILNENRGWIRDEANRLLFTQEDVI